MVNIKLSRSQSKTTMKKKIMHKITETKTMIVNANVHELKLLKGKKK